MNATATRSDVLRPLSMQLGLLLLAVVALVQLQAPLWLLITIVGLVAAAFLTHMIAYLYCLYKDRDALRSEKYNVQKMAIEHGVYGDSATGLIEPDDGDVEKLLPPIDETAGSERARG